jgi:hypothetical protein
MQNGTFAGLFAHLAKVGIAFCTLGFLVVHSIDFSCSRKIDNATGEVLVARGKFFQYLIWGLNKNQSKKSRPTSARNPQRRENENGSGAKGPQ